jgi:L,D-peptidoglycan transpeptidase YkuD (ErfK/YbiS/YcfS/YnhG family)
MNEAPAPADRSVPLSDLARTSNRIALASFGGGLSARPREVAVRTTDRSIAQAALTVAATVVGARGVKAREREGQGRRPWTPFKAEP